MKKLNFLLLFFLLAMNTFAQKKSIKDHYQAWVNVTFAGDQAIFKPELGEVDLQNGYCKFAKMGMAQMYGSMAVWRTSTGKELIGVFTYGCQMGTCSGNVNNIKFYDAEMNDITPQVLSNTTIEKDYQLALDQIQARGADGSETFFCQIPQKGTTIRCIIKMGKDLMSDGWEYPIAELTFNSQTGKFLYKKK